MSTQSFAFQVLLLDIEGTTTPISFVHDVLFPYAREHMADFIKAKWGDSAVQADLADVRKQHQCDIRDEIPALPPLSAPSEEDTYKEELINYLLWQMDNDRKTTGLKSLQGKIWKEGYAKGVLKGDVFDDVAEVFTALQRKYIPIYIYSSGSIQAQKLLFGQTVSGDLLPFLSGHFDTTTGSKKEPSSYTAIAASIGVSPGGILFATDILAEAEAADKAGMQVVLMDRPGNHPQPCHSYPVLETLQPLIPSA